MPTRLEPPAGRLTGQFVTLYIGPMMADTSQGRGAEAGGGRGETVPEPAVRRLSLYLRELEGLLDRQCETTSSRQLGSLLNLTDAQVRKDLACFGQFGHPGVGYRVSELVVRIRSILGTDRTWNALLVGAGHLGRALLSYRGFARKGFRLVAAFDNDPTKVHQRIGAEPGILVEPMERLPQAVKQRDIEMAILAVPQGVAQTVADRLAEAGIKGILNFAPTSISVPAHVSVATVDLAVHLEQLAFRICTRQVELERPAGQRPRPGQACGGGADRPAGQRG